MRFRNSLYAIFVSACVLFIAFPCYAADISYTYDDAGRLIRVDYGPQLAEQFTYDSSGNLLRQEVGQLDEIPNITSVSQTSGPAGAQIVIIGTNLDGSDTKVSFGGVEAAIISISDTQIVAVVPAGAITGPITVVNASGTAAGSTIFTITPAVTQIGIPLPSGAASSSITVGPSNALHVGYSTLTVNSGAAPYATAVFSYTQNGVIVSEVGVPSSPPTTSARFFVEYRTAVASAGNIDINTGFAAVNRGTAQANLTLRLINASGATIANGSLHLAKDAHISKFINQLAPDLVLPADFLSAGFGVLDIASDQPLSILALRLTTNQNDELKITSTPIADLTKAAGITPVSFPQVADGGGYQTALLFLNTTDRQETGAIQFYSDSGTALVVKMAGGASGSTFAYSISPGGYLRMVTDGSPTDTHVGWVLATPDVGASMPVSAGVFSYTVNGILVTESGVPASIPTTHARIYIDTSNGHNTGLAVATADASGATLNVNAFQTDGVTPAGVGGGTLSLAGLGHDAKFVGQIINGLPDDFTGLLDITSTKPFMALTLRSLANGRGDFLLTTFPIADANREPPSPVVFPQIADGGGYQTQFILLGASAGESDYTLNFLDEDGLPVAVGWDLP
jgi:YD repeat-containing protein